MKIRTAIGMKYRTLALVTVSVYLLSNCAFGKPIAFHTIVASYNPEARQVALDILKKGGNAFDAFIAATFVEYVVAPGVTSMAGPFAALVYEAKSGNTSYVDATFNMVAAKDGQWHPGDPDGKAVLIPGAVAGLEAISKKLGRLSFAEVIRPARALAYNGFQVSRVYSALIRWRSEILKRSQYGARTYFKDGSPLTEGDILRLPEVGMFLDGLMNHGSKYAYEGLWARELSQHVSAAGGLATVDDLGSYRAKWTTPRKTVYRGYELHSSSGRTFGSIWQLLALKTLEHTILDHNKHFSSDVNSLETMVRTARAVWEEDWFKDTAILDSDKLVLAKLTDEYTSAIWKKIQKKESTAPFSEAGIHSFHIIVADGEGNVVTGTNTIEAFPWADGIFVQGIPLNNAGKLPFNTRPGERVVSPMASHIVFKGGELVIATGTFNSSLIEAGFQFLVNSIDYDLDAESSAWLPRFGGFPFDLATLKVDGSKNWLDPKIDRSIVDELGRRGLKFVQDGYVDTGSGAVIKRAKTSGWTGGMPTLAGYENKVEGILAQ